MTNLLDYDEFVMGYSVLFMGTILKILIWGPSYSNCAIVLFGLYVFRRRYLMICQIDKLCYTISQEFSKIRDTIPVS
jgi:hypothetical protein